MLAQAKAEAKKNKQPPKKNVNVHFHIADDQAELDFKKADGSPYTAKMLLDDMAGAGDADKGGSLVDGPNGPFTDIFPDFVVLNRDGAAELAKKVRALTAMLLSSADQLSASVRRLQRRRSAGRRKRLRRLRSWTSRPKRSRRLPRRRPRRRKRRRPRRKR